MKSLPLTWLWWSLGLLLFAALLLLSLLPQVPLPLVFSWSDKAVHAIAYFSVVSYCGNLLKPRHFITLTLLVWLLSASIEIVQPYTGRFFDGYDLLANFAGCLTGLGFLLIGGHQILLIFLDKLCRFSSESTR